MNKSKLKSQGFRPITGFEPLYINRKGDVYNPIAQKYVRKYNGNRFTYNSKSHHIAKAILLAFKQEPYKHGAIIHYIDGNSQNLDPSNIEYRGKLNKTDRTTLLTAIRCYFQVAKRYRANETPATRYYLWEIARLRIFFLKHKHLPHIDIFRDYIENIHYTRPHIGKLHNLPIRRVCEIIEGCLQIMVDEILADVHFGALNIKEYQPPRGGTARLLKSWQSFIDAIKNGSENCE